MSTLKKVIYFDELTAIDFYRS